MMVKLRNTVTGVVVTTSDAVAANLGSEWRTAKTGGSGDPAPARSTDTTKPKRK